MDLARLGGQGDEPGPAFRSIHDLAVGRRPAAGGHHRSENRQRVQPQPSVERRGRRDRRRATVREPVRPRRHDRHDLAGTDHGVCAMSRPQVRSRSPSAITTACSMHSTACRRAARPSSSRREFASRHRSSNSPPRKTRRGSPSSKPQISAAEHDSKLAVDSAFEGWRAGIAADGKPAAEKGLPDALAAILRKPEAERTDDEKKSLDAGSAEALRRQGAAEPGRKVAGDRQARRAQETTGRLPGATSSRASW